jgi:hypothetical protein
MRQCASLEALLLDLASNRRHRPYERLEHQAPIEAVRSLSLWPAMRRTHRMPRVIRALRISPTPRVDPSIEKTPARSFPRNTRSTLPPISTCRRNARTNGWRMPVSASTGCRRPHFATSYGLRALGSHDVLPFLLVKQILAGEKIDVFTEGDHRSSTRRHLHRRHRGRHDSPRRLASRLLFDLARRRQRVGVRHEGIGGGETQTRSTWGDPKFRLASLVHFNCARSAIDLPSRARRLQGRGGL